MYVLKWNDEKDDDDKWFGFFYYLKALCFRFIFHFESFNVNKYLWMNILFCMNLKPFSVKMVDCVIYDSGLQVWSKKKKLKGSGNKILSRTDFFIWNK